MSYGNEYNKQLLFTSQAKLLSLYHDSLAGLVVEARICDSELMILPKKKPK